MPNTQFITLLIITVFSLLAGIVSAVVLFGQLNAKKRERAELERRLENTVGAAMNSSVGNASAELERRLQDRLKELSDALYRYNEQTKNDYERFKNALNESIASSMRETASRLAEAQTAAAERISAEQKAFSEKLNTEQKRAFRKALLRTEVAFRQTCRRAGFLRKTDFGQTCCSEHPAENTGGAGGNAQ